MNTEIQKIIAGLKEVLSGSPWYGKSANTLLDEIDPEIVYKKFNDKSHSLIDVLYHMVTWTEFTLHRLEKSEKMVVNEVEALDWRETNSSINTWNNGLAQFNAANNKIIELLKTTSDEILEEIVDYRQYNFRVLLNGLIQHHIYHLGQVAYVNKLLS
ncbi:MAG: DinB family protein [Chitinophagaceae bacterium]